jgi:hypothetical protein
MSNVKQRMDFLDHRVLSVVVEVDQYRNAYIDIRKRVEKLWPLQKLLGTISNIANN